MAGLSPDELANVAAILDAQPGLTSSQVRAAAGLAPTQLFAVRHARKQLGYPEPARQATSSTGKRRRRGKGASSTGTVATDTLEDDAADQAGPDEPTGPGRSAWRPKSLLTPILPRLAQAGVEGLMSATKSLTGGAAPMTRAEAQAVAIPAVRIADRTAAKYIKRTGKVTENQEDIALICLALFAWLAGWLIQSLRGRPSRGAQLAQAQAAAQAEADLFTGAEPVAPVAARPAPTAQPVAPSDARDDGDLFGGSEPVAAGVAGVAVNGHRPPTGSPAPTGVSEQLWQAIMPTDLGEGMGGE